MDMTEQERLGAPDNASLSSEKWCVEIQVARKNQEQWTKSGQDIVKRYLDRRDTLEDKQNKVNLFTTNTNILMATLYARIPKPMVTREFEDQSDDVARVAGMIVERCMKVQQGDPFDTAMRYVVQDRLVPGLGTVWMRYEPTFKTAMTDPEIDQFTGEWLTDPQEVEVIDTEKVCTDYVFWEDVSWSPVRIWEDMTWIARKVKMVKADAEKRFGAKICAIINFDGQEKKDVGDGEKPKSKQKFATIFEIWCKRSKKVYWVQEGCPTILDIKEDLLGLDEFWPCPRFLHSMMSTSNFMPRADYLMAQDQYRELDSVNERIVLLEKAIRVVGFYDGNNSDIERIFSEGADNKLYPLRSFRDFAEKGGFKGSVDWFPIENIVSALDKLRSVRQDLVTQIYEITGISDIMRGSSKASETLGAQQLKAQYSSVKLQHLQMEVATFVQNSMQLKSEIIAKHFQPENIKLLANTEHFQEEDMQFIDAAIELIKSGLMKYRIEVHADSMAIPEFNAERDGRLGFLRALAEIMTAAAPILEKDPSAAIGMLKVVQWGAASFRTGREIEGVLDQAIKGIEQSVKQPKPPQPDPEQLKIASMERIASAKLQSDQQAAQMKMQWQEQMDRQKLQNEMLLQQAKMEQAQQIAILEAKMKQQTELMVARIEAMTDESKIQMAASADMAKAAIETAAATESNESGEKLEKLEESNKQTQELLNNLIKTVSRTRRRIPRRDANGDIISVDEEIIGE